MASDAMVVTQMGESSPRTGVTLLILTLPVLFCLTHLFLGHLKPVHVLFSLLVLGLYFASSYSRVFVLLAIPFAMKDILFDGICYVHFDWLKPTM